MKVFDFLSNDDISGPGVVLPKILPLARSVVYQDFDKGTFPAKDILEKMKLEKKYNDEELLFFFYTRPARRFFIKSKEDPEFEEFIAPVVFIIKPILKKCINKVYPFDSGAFQMYKDNRRLGPTAALSDYELPNNFLAIRQYIKAIFGSNNNYYYGKRKSDDKLPDCIVKQRITNKDLDNFLHLIAEYKPKDEIDDRRKTVEIQSANDFDLHGNLLAIIAPNFCLDDEVFNKTRKKNRKIEILGYEYKEMSHVYDHEDIYRSAEIFFNKNGYNITLGDNYES